MADTLVEVKHLKQYFDISTGAFSTKPLKAVDDVSFSIHRGRKPQDMTEQSSVPWPGPTGSRAAITWVGVICSRPPKGTSTEPAPMVESNRSTSPRWLARLGLWRMDSHLRMKLSPVTGPS